MKKQFGKGNKITKKLAGPPSCGERGKCRWYKCQIRFGLVGSAGNATAIWPRHSKDEEQKIGALLKKTSPSQTFPHHKLVLKVGHFSGLVIDGKAVVLICLGCHSSKVNVPREGLQPNPTWTCPYFTFDKTLVLPNKAERLALLKATGAKRT